MPDCESASQKGNCRPTTLPIPEVQTQHGRVDNELLIEALAARARGFALLPVQGNKTPASRAIHNTRGHYGWKPLGDRPADEDEIRAWDEHHQVVGIAVITGHTSRVIVHDVDKPELAPELPATARSITRRGWHDLFQLDDEESPRTRAYPWGELRGEGGYAILPTSTIGGHRYCWEVSPDDVGELTGFSRARDFLPLITKRRTTCFLVKESRPRLARLAHLAHEDATAALADLERDEATALRLAAALGAPDGVRLGENFRCLVHRDQRPSGGLWRREPDAHVLYRDWHDHTWLTLAGVRAVQAGRVGPLNPPELAVWKARLAAEAGLLELPELYPDADPPPEELRPVWDGFCELVAVRWAVTPGAPAPFSVRFAASWCGITARQAHESIGELARRGFLRVQGRDPVGTRLWLPKGVMPHA
jgi:hypothetical protein